VNDELHVVCFPFDAFGNAGCGAGAALLTDAVYEIIEDTEHETRPTRADAYRGRIEVTECTFETMPSLTAWRESGSKCIRQSLIENCFTLWLGGNHLSVLPVYESLDANDLVVQFDAHLDIFDLHDTVEELSHGNFLRHAASLPKIINIGHRDLLIPFDSVRKIYREAVSTADITTEFPAIAKQLGTKAAKAKRVWIDIDVDVFDPAFAPAVHQRTPFGLLPQQLLKLLDTIWSERVVGVSISEFDPGRDVNDQTLLLLGWLVEWILLRAAETK
jgi:agmatinase